MDLLAMGAATWNVVVFTWLGWRYGCRLNQAAIDMDGSAARRSLLGWLVSATLVAASLNIIWHGGI